MYRFTSHFTVEPAYFLYSAVFAVLEPTFTNLILQKKCRLNATSEPDLSSKCDINSEREGLLFASNGESISQSGALFVSAIFTVFALCWSDIAGPRRRPLVLLPIIGIMLQSLTNFLHSYFWYWQPISAIATNALFSMIGGVILMKAITQVYISDLTNEDNRTIQLVFLEACKNLGGIVGYGSSGYLLHSLGFVGTYCLCFIVSIASLILAWVLVKDVSEPVTTLGNCRNSVWMKIIDSFRIVFAKSLGRGRIIVFILMIIFCSVCFTTFGEQNILYKFLRYEFKWEERQFSLYVMYRRSVVTLGCLFYSLVLKKCLKIHDGLIGVFAGFCTTLAAVGYLFASQEWHLYIVPLFDAFHSTVSVACLSFMSKFYKPDERGRLYSVVGIFGLVIPSCHVVYNEIFQRTLDSTYFILSIVIDILVVAMYYVTYLLSKQTKNKEFIPLEGEEGNYRLCSDSFSVSSSL